MEFKNQEKYSQLGKLGLLGLVFGFLGYSFFGIFFLFFPMPFMESSVRNGIVPALGTMLGVSLALGLAFGILSGLSLFFVFGPLVLIFHYMVESKKTFAMTLLAMTLVLLLSFFSLQLGLTPLETIDFEKLSEEIIEIQMSTVEEGLSALESDRLEYNLRKINEITIKILPGIFFIFILFTVYINYVLVGRRLLRSGILINQPPLFGNLQLPRLSILALGLVIGLALALQAMGYEIYKIIYLNALVIFGFLFLINGLSMVSYFLNRLRIPNIFRTIFLLGLVLFAPAGAILIIVGLLDALVNFRKININRK